MTEENVNVAKVVDEVEALAVPQVTLGQFLTVLATVETNLEMVKKLLAEADANPIIWTLPGLNKLKPYEAMALPVIDFLLKLDQTLESVLNPTTAT